MCVSAEQQQKKKKVSGYEGHAVSSHESDWTKQYTAVSSYTRCDLVLPDYKINPFKYVTVPKIYVEILIYLVWNCWADA